MEIFFNHFSFCVASVATANEFVFICIYRTNNRIYKRKGSSSCKTHVRPHFFLLYLLLFLIHIHRLQQNSNMKLNAVAMDIMMMIYGWNLKPRNSFLLYQLVCLPSICFKLNWPSSWYFLVIYPHLQIEIEYSKYFFFLLSSTSLIAEYRHQQFIRQNLTQDYDMVHTQQDNSELVWFVREVLFKKYPLPNLPKLWVNRYH
jgi:hypothetical protein